MTIRVWGSLTQFIKYRTCDTSMYDIYILNMLRSLERVLSYFHICGCKDSIMNKLFFSNTFRALLLFELCAPLPPLRGWLYSLADVSDCRARGADRVCVRMGTLLEPS